ncbi:hypothetical protein [Kitasatospora sp. NPDC018619]|uniref:hypothetical protein n=1 Tax=unclassified Kitasatospora TaxID=2633591 RepID=UPI0037973F8C
MTINQKLFRQGWLATTSTLAALAAATAQATATTEQAAPAPRDDGPHRYRVSVRATGARALPSGLASFTVHVRRTGGQQGARPGESAAPEAPPPVRPAIRQPGGP